MKYTISKFIGLGLIISALSGCPKADVSPDKKLEQIVIKVGEGYSINCLRINYCGMINEKTFSISESSQFATNIFYPVSTKEFEFFGRELRIDGVTSEEIRLTYLGMKK
jgi:hypothetical protein